MANLAANKIGASFDLDKGLLAEFQVEDEGPIAPLHHAPWVGQGESFPADAPPHLAWLGGDFFCAPFAAAAEGSALHGWPANSSWSIVEQTGSTVRARLDRAVFGAELIKELYLHDDHPFVYQRHTFIGGQGDVPVANHANISLPNGGLIRTSTKCCWMTPVDPPEADPARGRSALKYPAKNVDPTAFPGIDGQVDLTRYPWRHRHEDFVIGIEAGAEPLGWTAVTRPLEGDLVLSLRCPKQLPMTMLWHSDGGRDYPPWSGRHFNCLGIEEGAAAHMLDRQPLPALRGPGSLTLKPDGQISVAHVIGAIRWPAGSAVASITCDECRLTVTGEDATSRQVPFNAAHLQLA